MMGPGSLWLYSELREQLLTVGCRSIELCRARVKFILSARPHGFALDETTTPGTLM